MRSKQKNKIHRTQMGKGITEATERLAKVSVALPSMLLIQCVQVILAQNHKPLSSERLAPECSAEHSALSECLGNVEEESLSSEDVSSEEGAMQILVLLFF